MFRTINILRFILNPRDKKQLLCLSFFSAVSALWEVAGIGLVLPVVAGWSIRNCCSKIAI